MLSVEEQLKQYRSKKAEERSKSSIFRNLLRNTSISSKVENDVKTTKDDKSGCDQMPFDLPENYMYHKQERGNIISSNAKLFLQVSLWLVLWIFAISIGFGAVYFVISSLFILYRTLRTSPRRPGELSAYSVFNPNYEQLDGTFTAEQFEKELRYGAGSVQ